MPQTAAEAGKRYYHYDGRRYEVIGAFKETGTVLDNTVYINLTALLESEDNLALYYVDAPSSTAVNQVITQMQKQAGDRYRTELMTYEPAAVYIGLTRVLDALLVFAVLAAMLNLAITLIFFVTRKKYQLAIQKFFGMTSRDLAWKYGKSVFAVIAACFALVVLGITGLSRYMGVFFTLDRLAVYHYILMGGVLVLLGIVAVYLIVRLAKRVDISDTLKGR